jgi:hypothetical protein
MDHSTHVKMFPRMSIGHAGLIGALTGVSWLLLLAVEMVPWIGLLFSAVILVPMVFLGLRGSLNDVLAGGVAFTIATFLLLGLPATVLFALGVWAPSAVMVAMIRQRRSVDAAILWPSIGPLVAGVLGVMAQLGTGGAAPVASLRTALRGQFEDALSLYRSMGMTEQELKAMAGHIDQAVTALLVLSPSVLLCSVVAIVLTNYGLVRRFAGGVPAPWSQDIPSLNRWQLHDGWVWGLIGSLLLMLVPAMPYRFVWLNVLVVVLFAYLLQGTAVVNHWAIARGVPRWVRYSVTALLLIQPLLLALLVFIGIADIWADSRKLRAVASTPP